MSLANAVNDNDLDAIFQPKAEESAPVAPHNLDIEQQLLGAILVNNDVLMKVDDRLQPEHFYLPSHQAIFKKISELHGTGMLAAPHTIGIHSQKALEMAALSAFVVISPLEHSQIIIDLHLKRKLIECAEQIILAIRNDTALLNGEAQLEVMEQNLFRLSQTGSATGTLEPFAVAVKKAVEASECAAKSGSELVGVSSGFASIDNSLGGFQNSDLIILAGRPSMGKTALATSIAQKVAGQFQLQEQKKSVAFFSLEMSDEQLANRILSAEADVNAQSVLRGKLTPEQHAHFIATSAKMSSLPLLIDRTASLSISALRSRARRFARTHNIGLVIVDYLQLLTLSERNRQFNRVQEVSEITQALKALAKDLNVPVIALSQLSRAVESREDKRPQLADLRDSGSIEQDADVVMFVYREEYYLSRSKPDESHHKFNEWLESMEKAKGKADVIIAKQRNGAIGNVMMRFDADKARFRDAPVEADF